MKKFCIYITYLILSGTSTVSHAALIPRTECYVEGKIISFLEIKESHYNNPDDFEVVESTSDGVKISITSVRPVSGVDDSCKLAEPGVHSMFNSVTDFEISKYHTQGLKVGDKIKGIVSHTGDEYGQWFGFIKIEKISEANLQ